MLTKKQLDLLNFINKRMARDGVPPSFDEMKDALNLRSKSGIHRLITALEERGFIRRLPHRARALEIVKLPESLGGAPQGFTPRVIEGDRPDSAPSRAEPLSNTGLHELPLMGRIAAGVPIEAINDTPPGVAVPGVGGRFYLTGNVRTLLTGTAGVDGSATIPSRIPNLSMVKDLTVHLQVLTGEGTPQAAYSNPITFTIR